MFTPRMKTDVDSDMITPVQIGPVQDIYAVTGSLGIAFPHFLYFTATY